MSTAAPTPTKEQVEVARAMLDDYNRELFAGGEPPFPQEAAEIVRAAEVAT